MDPNADFRRLSEVENDYLWDNANYDVVNKKGKLPHEKSRDEFANSWSSISIRIRTGERTVLLQSISPDPKKSFEKIRISWTALDANFFAGEIDSILSSELFHCHQFVRGLEAILEFSTYKDDRELIDEAERLINLSKSFTLDQLNQAIVSISKFSRSSTSGKDRKKKITIPFIAWEFDVTFTVWINEVKPRLESFFNYLFSASMYISDPVIRFYFSKAREFQSAGILESTIDKRLKAPIKNPRIDIIDLPSLDDKIKRFIVTNAILSSAWNEARASWENAINNPPQDDERIPIFILLDEAHNLISNNPQGKAELALRDQFRTIASEGRKYGIFLLLVSQRPDKLDPVVLSECENKALMRVSSESLLKMTAQAIGLENVPFELLRKCLDFGVGRVLLTGRWSSGNPKILYTAARRTIEGGRNLRAEYWTLPHAYDDSE